MHLNIYNISYKIVISRKQKELKVNMRSCTVLAHSIEKSCFGYRINGCSATPQSSTTPPPPPRPADLSRLSHKWTDGPPTALHLRRRVYQGRRR